MRNTFVFYLLLAACGDNLPGPATDAPADAPPDARPPPATFRQTCDRWAEAYCGLFERCWPEDLAKVYPDGCVTTVAAKNCRLLGSVCDAPYPAELVPALQECEEKMATWSCGSLYPPKACYRAFGNK